MFRTFRGGIRFDLLNSEAAKAQIRKFDEGSVYNISMRQFHTECEPTVSVGARVLRFERIGRSMSANGADVCSPVSGRITAIGEMPHPLYKKSLCVTVESDGKNEVFPPLGDTDPENIPRDEIFDIARRAAIPGPDQYSEPEFLRMRKMLRDGVRTLVCGAVECEPYLGTNTRICAQYANEVVGGLKLMMRAIGAQNGIVAVTSGSTEVETEIRAAIKKTVKDNETKIRISDTVNKYPAVMKLQDMFETAAFELSSKTAKAGVTSPFACMALYRAVRDSIPVTDVMVTVAGSAIGRPGVFEVPVGSSVKDLLNRALVSEDLKTVIMGGVMRGIALDGTDYPVLIGTSSIIAMSETTQFSRSNECIHCNQCGKVCPQGLSPSQICEYILHGDVTEAARLGLTECMLCGCCTYICPGRMELNDILLKGKESMRK